MKLIDKDALVAKIWKRRNKHFNFGGSPSSEYCHEDDEILGIINTLEVKEVDLEEEIERVRKTHFINDDFEKATLEGRQITNIAKHFFELGVKASNPLTWEDIANINDIVSEIIKECDDNILYDTKEDFCKEVLNRFKAQKGE